MQKKQSCTSISKAALSFCVFLILMHLQCISQQFTCILMLCKMSYQDFDKELEDRRKQEEDEQVTGWNAVEIDETPVNITVSNPCL